MNAVRGISLAALAASMPSAVFGAVQANGSPMPRAILRANANDAPPAQLMNDLITAVSGFNERNEGRIGDIEASLNRILAGDAGRAAGGLFADLGAGPHDSEYSKLFASYIRSGGGADELRRLNGEGSRAQVHAAMSAGSDSAGGYLAPTEWDRAVHKAQVVLSPMRRLAKVITTGVGAYSTVWSDNSWGSGWVGETAARPATTTPTLSSLTFASGEIYANAAVTQRLLDDSELDLEMWLATELGDEFTKLEGVAFISGNGTNKPRGLLSYVTGGASDGAHPGGNLTIVSTAAIGTITLDDLIGFAYSLSAPYRQGASWLMASTTAAYLAKLKDGEGNYLWRESTVVGQPATLLGYPVEIDEGMPAIANDALPIAFGNFREGYVINDRFGTRILRDPYTNKPYVMFYGTKRVGGGVEDPNAIRLLKVKAA